MPEEYRLGNFTPKGWILNAAHKASGFYPDTLERSVWAAIEAYKQLSKAGLI